MLLNVITRTSSRPIYFDNFYRSYYKLKGQKELWVTVDDDNSLEYVYLKGIKNIIRVEKPSHGNCPWNMYLNKALYKINGWCVVVDDDDQFLREDLIPHLEGQIEKETDVIFWRVQFPNTLIPDDNHWQKRFTAGQISMIGMCFHSSWKDKWGDLWDTQCLGDYKLALKFWEDPQCNIKWIDKTFTGIKRKQTGGHGRRDDLKS